MVVRKKQPGFCPEAQARFDMSGAELRTHEAKTFSQTPHAAPVLPRGLSGHLHVWEQLFQDV